MNNNNGGNGGYYIELEGLNSTQLGGNISIEMVIQNDELTVSGSNKKVCIFQVQLLKDNLPLMALHWLSFGQKMKQNFWQDLTLQAMYLMGVGIHPEM